MKYIKKSIQEEIQKLKEDKYPMPAEIQNALERNNKIFKMPKFRSMQITTPDVATHLLDNPNSYLSPICLFLRTKSIQKMYIVSGF